MGHRSERGKLYDAYISGRLLPGRWKAKCDAVRVRAGGVCERCGLLWISETHHLTYDHVLDEALEDLLGVCRECHKTLGGFQEEDPLKADYGQADKALVRWVFQEASLYPQRFERMLQRLQKEAWETWFCLRQILDVRLRHTNPYTR